MAKLKLDIPKLKVEFKVGDDKTLEFNWRTAPPDVEVTEENKDTFPLVDTTGMTALMQIKALEDTQTDLSTAPVLLEFTDADAIELDAANSPNLSVTMSHANSLILGPGEFVTEIQITDSLGKERTIQEWDITMIGEITVT